VTATRTFVPCAPIDLGLTLGPLRRGRGDGTARVAADGFWKATRTPDGPATVCVRASGGGVAIEARAWGAGSDWVLERAATLVGASDDPDAFVPDHPVVARLHRRLRGLRIPRTERVVEALVPSILEQKVTGIEARRSWASIVRTHGERAPGPADLLLPPSPAVLAALPYHAFHRHGVERRRADTIRRACRVAARLEEAAAMDPAAAARRLQAVPGIGPWTAAEVALVALGDRDAVSVGDYHLPHQVAWALAGEPRGDDARMLELLAPFVGHRGLVARLVALSGSGPPRRAPRARLRSFVTM
jgi:3-methyladenine DNA glycosylase/8-oxoguanine DNA glycosylase